MLNKAIIGKKVGMTQIFNADGKVIPCTVIEAGPCVVTQLKTEEKDGYNAVQFGFEDVKEALNAIDVNGITVSQVMGCGAQRGYKKRVRGTEVDVMMQPKIKFEIVVSSEEWEKATIDAIQKAAFTGEVGDGKIFSYEIRTATKIRTRESGADALN